MTEGAEESLSERAQLLLKALIENYIRDGQPVGSRTLSRDSGLSLSSATIRNVMADLEDLGFVASPHTSAGRIPTDKGYRFFVDTLLKLKPLHHEEIEEIERRLASDASNGRSLGANRLPDALERHAYGGPGDAAESELHRPLADRIHRAVGESRARDHGHEQPRGAEPGGAARPLLLGRGAAARRQLFERGVCRSLAARCPGDAAQAAAGDPAAHESAHAGRHPGRPKGLRQPARGSRSSTSSPGRPT